MNHTVITSTQAPAAIGPYSQAIMTDHTLYTSGILPINAEGKLQEGIVAQTRQILTNLQNVLSEASLTLEDVVKTSVFMTNLDHFGEMNDMYSNYFGNHHPARTTVQVAKLPRGAEIEIELVAIKRPLNQ
ncbi:Rid family detoxifying hydrolase [Paenibacillus sp. 2003]|uniref:Rid family detoxifying hydrolase n=1 Tax=Paenibacillus TaxID=44249 RepID=UPI0028584D9D|nr:Rid family detoxifying hydrolase [Paenibacillus sp. 2003]MDR6718848.1 2-iminobutanoate/2-iminopropanoate deaminase [Paenibacillus sp. 2003]